MEPKITIKNAVNHWNNEYEQARMIRGLKGVVISFGIIIAIELILIVLLIWRHHG